MQTECKERKVAGKIGLLWCMFLKGKLSNIIFKSLFEQKMDSDWAAPKQKQLRAFYQQDLGERFLQRKGRGKIGQLLTGYSLQPIWLFVIGCS